MTVKTMVKTGLKWLHNHRQALPDVFIFTLPRAGSTLLLEILNTDSACKSVSEPLALNRHNRRVLRRYFAAEVLNERYTDLADTHWLQMLQYFADLSAGRTWNSYYWSDFPGRDHQLRTQRTIFKTHKITYLFDDFMRAFPTSYGVYLLRHPLAQSISRMRNGWDTYNNQYLQAHKISGHLSKAALTKAREVLDKGSDLERFVLSWCMEHFVFFYLHRQQALPQRLFPVCYESLVMHTASQINTLCEHLQIPFLPRMAEKVAAPSRGIVHSTGQARANILQGEKERLLSQWRAELSEQEEEKAFAILRAFQIDWYEAGNPYPIRIGQTGE